jgi:hypothetical protein
MSQLPHPTPRSSRSNVAVDVIDVDQYALDAAKREQREVEEKWKKVVGQASKAFVGGSQVSPLSE